MAINVNLVVKVAFFLFCFKYRLLTETRSFSTPNRNWMFPLQLHIYSRHLQLTERKNSSLNAVKTIENDAVTHGFAWRNICYVYIKLCKHVLSHLSTDRPHDLHVKYQKSVCHHTLECKRKTQVKLNMRRLKTSLKYKTDKF